MKITITAVGRWKSGPEQEIFNDYLKRTRWKIELKEVEEKKNLPPEKLKIMEAELLIKAAGKTKKIVLDERGKNLSTREFADAIIKLNEQSSDGIAFMIGGADGHGDELRNSADLLISFGKMTWPHMLVRPMLAEQLYRAWCISNNHPYHRD